MVKKSFLKTGISNNLDGSEDGYLWNEYQEEDVVEYISPLWDTDEDVPQKRWEEPLVTVKMRKKMILNVFGCYLPVVENRNQNNFVMFFEPN